MLEKYEENKKSPSLLHADDDNVGAAKNGIMAEESFALEVMRARKQNLKLSYCWALSQSQ